MLFLPLELGRPAVVEVAKGYADLDLDIGAAPHAMAAKVTASAEEPAEKVEGVVVAAASALLPLLKALVAVLIVDFAGLGVDEGFVGFGNFDKLILRGFVAPVRCGTSVSWTRGECVVLAIAPAELTGSCQGGTSWIAFGTLILFLCRRLVC